MKYLKKSGLVATVVLIATCGVLDPARATTIDPPTTAFTLTATNFSLAISSGSSITCADASIRGTTPAAGAGSTWKAITNVTRSFAGCTAFGFINASVTPSGCDLAPDVVHVMDADTSTAVAVITQRSGCSIDVSIPAVGCTLTIPGPQTFGGGDLTDVPFFGTVGHFLRSLFSMITSNGVGLGCPSAGAHTGTMTADYVQTTSPQLFITP